MAESDMGAIKSLGFERDGERYFLEREIMDGSFVMRIEIDRTGELSYDVRERESGEEYVLYKTGATGSFVGEMRREIDAVLGKIRRELYHSSVFTSGQARLLIDFVRDSYGDEPEFLWESSPDCAVWRRRDSSRWYGVIMKVKKSKLGFDSDETAEIVDLHIRPELMDELRRDERYLPGWHMNKKSWYTVVLDGGVDDSELFGRVSDSYQLAAKQKRGKKP